MITGTYPYEPLTTIGRADLLSGKIKNLQKLKEKTPVKLVNMILKCLEPDPKKRCDFKHLLFCDRDSWFDEMRYNTYRQLKPKILKEEADYKRLIEQLVDIKFSNRLCRIV